MVAHGAHSVSRLDRLFSTDGKGSGVTDMARAANDYFVMPAPNELMNIARILVYIEDDAKFQGGGYIGSAALSTGITITKENADGVIHNYTPLPLTKIGHWALCAGVDVVMTDFTTGNDFFLVRWTLSKAEHETHLNGKRGEFLKITVPDSLAALVSHIITAQGSVEHIF